MRDTFYRFLPWVLGFLIGWLMFRPPAWLDALGPLAYVVHALLIGALLLSVVALMIAANLPARLKMTEVSDDEVHADLRRLGEGFERIGFRRVGAARRVNVAPSAILLGFVHEREPVYATAFRTETTQPKTGCDVVSIIHGDRGGLTTNADPAGAALPEGPGGLRQVFPGATADRLFQHHLEALAYLRERGVHCRQVSADMFEQDFAAAMSRQRDLFLASPLRATLITLWRAATKQVPFVGALRDQKVAAEQITRLLSGGLHASSAGR